MEVMETLSTIFIFHDFAHIAIDISGSNVAFTCSNLSTATKEDLFQALGDPECEELTRLDGKPLGKALPKYLVAAAKWDSWVDEEDEDLRIIDLGEGFLQGQEPTTLAQPGPLRVPETIFGEPFDHRIDLWRAGCVVSGLTIL
jgi:serine/threonine-protein kinase SRPK3